MLTLLWAKHALCARLGLSAVYYSTQKKLAGVAVPASSPLSSEGFNMMSTSVSQRRSRKHRSTRATGPSIYPALISHKRKSHCTSERQHPRQLRHVGRPIPRYPQPTPIAPLRPARLLL